MYTIIIKRIDSSNYLALCEGEHVASITRPNRYSCVLINRIGHVRVFPALLACKRFLENCDIDF